MFETMMTTLSGIPPILAAAPGLTMIYIICLIVGGGVLVVSTVFGGDGDAGLDADVDVDVDIDVDADVAAEGAEAGAAPSLSLSTWFSMQFVVYFVAAFGLVGTVLTYTSTVGSAGTLVASLAAGLVIGQGVHQLMRALRRSSGDSKAMRRDFVNKPARVTIAIKPPERGEVALQVRGREKFVPAWAQRTDDRFEAGSSVVIVTFANGTAHVVSQEEYEFVTDSKTGGSDEPNSDRTV